MIAMCLHSKELQNERVEHTSLFMIILASMISRDTAGLERCNQNEIIQKSEIDRSLMFLLIFRHSYQKSDKLCIIIFNKVNQD